MVALILDELGRQVRPGLSTMACEEIVQKMCAEFKVKPGFQGLYGYPYALCCAVNEVIVHGFPSEECVLKEGDIVSFDMGVVYQGMNGDAARTFMIGEVSDEAARLVRVTERALLLAWPRRGGNDLYAISEAVQRHAEGAGFHVVRRFVGHGVGASLHEKPEVPNFVPAGRPGPPLKVGMVLAIEPMITVGTPEVEILDDKWTAVTKDRSLAAHWEHSVAILPDGPHILDLP